MPCMGCFASAQPVEFFILVTQYGIPYNIIYLRIPFLRNVIDQSFDVPFRHGEQRRILDLCADTRSIYHLVENDLGNAGPDLPLKVIVVAIKIDQHLTPDDPCDTPRVVAFPVAHQPDIALLQIGKAIENDEK